MENGGRFGGRVKKVERARGTRSGSLPRAVEGDDRERYETTYLPRIVPHHAPGVNPLLAPSRRSPRVVLGWSRGREPQAMNKPQTRANSQEPPHHVERRAGPTEAGPWRAGSQANLVPLAGVVYRESGVVSPGPGGLLTVGSVDRLTGHTGKTRVFL